MITLQNLSIGFKYPLVANINLTSKKGNIITLLGRNGSGKSTLLKTICGLIRPLEGNVFIDNYKVFTSFSHGLNVAAVFQFNDGIPNTDVYTFISFGRYNNANKLGRLKIADYEYIDYIIRLLKLENLLYKNFNTLSDGEKQKVLIARAFVQNTPLIILDEPTAFLDIIHKNELFELIINLADTTQKTFIISTHDLDMAIKYANEFWLINNFRLIQIKQSEGVKYEIYNTFGISL